MCENDPPPDEPEQDPTICYDINKKYWDTLASLHFTAPSYNVERFKEGELTLLSPEREEVGDVEGKTLLHLQCHFGLDTLSWARLGAIVTGVDFSHKAIELATKLSQELEIPARFIEDNIYSLDDSLAEEFDIVFASYGVLHWLNDLVHWAQIVANHLKPGGFFYIIEVHPFSNIIYNIVEPPATVDKDYFDLGHAIADHPENSYTGQPIPKKSQEYVYWNHTLEEIITVLADAGLRIEFVHAFPFTCFQQFTSLEQHEDGFYYFPAFFKQVPLLFSLKASKI